MPGFELTPSMSFRVFLLDEVTCKFIGIGMHLRRDGLLTVF